MKRSLKLSLALMGTGGLLAGCAEPPQDVITFKDVDECAASGKFTRDICEAQHKQALNQAEKELRYRTSHACTNDFDQCVPVRDDIGREFFVPVMAGFMMTHAAIGVADALEDLSEADMNREKTKLLREQRKALARQNSRALYTSRDDRSTLRTGNNTAVGSVYSTGKVTQVKHSTYTSNAKPKATLSRGSFGKAAARTASTSSSGRSGGSWGG